MGTARFFILCLVFLNATVAARAEDIEDKVNTVLERVLEEWTVLISCSALEPGTQEILSGSWNGSINKTTALLGEKGMDAAFIESVSTRMGGLKPIATINSPARDLIAYCHAHPDWKRKLIKFEYAIPHEAISAVFGGLK